ncbi:MAG: tRNA guanosine(15) transglycosylase TgtA [Thermoprotei archaeon]
MRLEPDAVFEVKHRSLRGKIGRLKTKRGYIETPALLPVIDVKRQLVGTERIRQLGFKAVMTNAYLLLKRGVKVSDIHEFLKFDGVIATDSGAYQMLEFGEIASTQSEIISFQEKINVDIGVILDSPTGKTDSDEWARQTVERTINNAIEFLKLRNREDILWVGPVQGGEYLNLVEYSAKKMAGLPFHIHGLGSPTEFLEGYRYTTILDMILHSKKHLPPSRPLHLFGAGHPAILPYFVALGVDLFDSASYALFAKDNRYLTSQKTYRLETLTELPCRCSVCEKYTAGELRGLNRKQREKLLAEHNLSVLAEEISRIKLAIYQGTLWDLLQSRVYSHPQIFEAFRWMLHRTRHLAKYSPITTPSVSGLFAFAHDRPETVLFRERITRFVSHLKPKRFVILSSKDQISKLEGDWRLDDKTLVMVLNEHFGLIPFEMLDVYPVYQTDSRRVKPDIRKILSIINAHKSASVATFDDALYSILRRKLKNVERLHHIM